MFFGSVRSDSDSNILFNPHRVVDLERPRQMLLQSLNGKPRIAVIAILFTYTKEISLLSDTEIGTNGLDSE